MPEARPHFERALQLQPASASAHQTYGRALLAARQTSEAAEHFRTALELDPNLPGLAQDLSAAGALGRDR
jgi:Flp pilus assembly protein TadD